MSEVEELERRRDEAYADYKRADREYRTAVRRAAEFKAGDVVEARFRGNDWQPALIVNVEVTGYGGV
jgi:hypothetical protein